MWRFAPHSTPRWDLQDFTPPRKGKPRSLQPNGHFVTRALTESSADGGKSVTNAPNRKASRFIRHVWTDRSSYEQNTAATHPAESATPVTKACSTGPHVDSNAIQPLPRVISRTQAQRASRHRQPMRPVQVSFAAATPTPAGAPGTAPGR